MHNSDLEQKGRTLALKATALVLLGSVSLVGPYLYNEEVERRKASIEKTEAGSSNIPKLKLPSGKPNFAEIEDTNAKKKAFFDYLRPSINLENRRISKERFFLEKLADKGVSNADAEDEAYAERLAKLYSLPLSTAGIDEKWVKEMLSRVNVIPEALVLTQAANESAWGTSRFATKANNYFGHWCYSKGCGLVPLQRNEGSTHEVAKFSSSQESVHRYFMNLNRNNAYQDLRNIRAELASKGDDLLTMEAATKLTEGLLKYSERGADYVTDLQAMIRYNKVYWVK